VYKLFADMQVDILLFIDGVHATHQFTQTCIQSRDVAVKLTHIYMHTSRTHSTGRGFESHTLRCPG